jgi:hypothetical protein
MRYGGAVRLPTLLFPAANVTTFWFSSINRAPGYAEAYGRGG